jgi:hypothetical protein
VGLAQVMTVMSQCAMATDAHEKLLGTQQSMQHRHLTQLSRRLIIFSANKQFTKSGTAWLRVPDARLRSFRNANTSLCVSGIEGFDVK